MAETDKTMASVLKSLETRQIEQPGLSRADKKARTVARLMRVQALYQMELSGIGVESVIREFSDHRLEGTLESEDGLVNLGDADHEFFAEGLRGIVANQNVIDTMVVDRLAQGWRMERLDATLRAWELKYRPDIATEIILDEYVEMAKAFFDESEARFVNGALDGVGRDCRTG